MTDEEAKVPPPLKNLSHAKSVRGIIAAVRMFIAGRVEDAPRLLKDAILASYKRVHKKDLVMNQILKTLGSMQWFICSNHGGSSGESHLNLLLFASLPCEDPIASTICRSCHHGDQMKAVDSLISVQDPLK